VNETKQINGQINKQKSLFFAVPKTPSVARSCSRSPTLSHQRPKDASGGDWKQLILKCKNVTKHGLGGLNPLSPRNKKLAPSNKVQPIGYDMLIDFVKFVDRPN